MYRPTVRYHDDYKDYVQNVFNATHLDRTQIIRAALFIAGHTKEFQELMDPYLKRGMDLPRPLWESDQNEYWLEQSATVNEPQPIKQQKPIPPQTHQQSFHELPRQTEQTSQPKVFTQQGISFKLGGS